MWMSFEDNPEHIPHFALIPVRRRININDRRERRLLPTHRDLQSHIGIAVVREQVINDSKVAGREAVFVTARAFIYRCQVIQHIERLTGEVPKLARSLVNSISRYPECGNAITGRFRLRIWTEFLL